ncbi:MAG: sigma-70 family RNA polymerase sigma factor [Hyphomicrobiaceae bacterium]|nr:sigma-70 family RNA polymerase sigma factor [Hyphomicrobiaceae bacterium]
MADPELARLLSRIALGDRQAFARLYELRSAKLFGLLIRLLKDRGEAEDVLQEVFVRIWQRADRFGASGRNAEAWTATLARNLAIDRLRARREAAPLDAAPEMADPAPGPEALAILSGEGTRIAACLGELDADKAGAVVKAYVEGWKYDELASHYAVPLNTMRTWLRRSLIALRDCLGG